VSERRWQLMNEGCDKGSGGECERAGDQAEDHGAEALPRYLKGCALDDAPSCAKVAWCYGDGRNGVKVDRRRALPYAETSCDADEPSGCDMLARLLRPTDPARARAILQRACRLEPYLYDCEK
jgi:TPR repeat protein